MSTAAAPKRPSRLPVVAQVAGIVGIVICVAIIAVVWLGRGAVSGTVDDLSTGVDNGIARATDATNTVASRLDDAATQVGQLVASATAVANNPGAPPEALTPLTERLGRFADAYRNLRTRYGELKENLTSAVTSLQRVAKFLPGVTAPEGSGVLPALDAKLQAIDDAITTAWPQEGDVTSAAATRIATAATAVQGAIADASASVRSLTDDLARIQAQAKQTLDTIDTIILVLALAATVFFVWVLILNIALWHLGRVWKRERQGQAVATSDMAPPTGTDGTPTPQPTASA